MNELTMSRKEIEELQDALAVIEFEYQKNIAMKANKAGDKIDWEKWRK